MELRLLGCVCVVRAKEVTTCAKDSRHEVALSRHVYNICMTVHSLRYWPRNLPKARTNRLICCLLS